MAGAETARSPRSSRRAWPVVRWRLALLDASALFVYLLLLTTAEIGVITLNPVLVFPLHGGLIAVTGAYVIVRRGLGMAGADPRIVTAAGVALTVAPLIRIISLTLPLGGLEPVYRYIAAGVPMALGGILAARMAGFGARQIGLLGRGATWQVLVVTGSIALGFAEFLILRPEPLGAVPWTAAGLWPALAIGIFTGFPEELIFRGVMQTALRPVLGRWNWVYVSGVFAVLHLGYSSYLDVVFVFAVGLFYGWIFERTRSIIGVSVGHGLANVVLFFVAPNIIGKARIQGVDLVTDPLLAAAFAAVLAVVAALIAFGSRRTHKIRGHTAAASASLVGPLRLAVIADPAAANVDAKAAIVPAGRVELPVTSRISAPATLVEHRTPVATGMVRFTSKNATEPILIVAGTVLLSIEERRFRTLKRAYLSRAHADGIAIADVPVEAEAAGIEGDVPAGSICRVPYKLAAEGVTVNNEAAMTGGTQTVIRRISASDYNEARVAASIQSWEEIRGFVAGRHVDPSLNRRLVPAATTVSTISMEPDGERAVGQSRASLELTLRRVATTVVVDVDHLREVAIAQLDPFVSGGFQLVPGSIDARVIATEIRGDSVICTLEVEGRQGRAADAMEPGDYGAA
jgi:membrane protease YdiL (CAAX protease family)